MATQLIHRHTLPTPVNRNTGDWQAPLQIRRPGDSRDLVSIAFEPATNLIRVYVGGSWTLAECERYIAALTTFIEGARALLGKARVVFDRRDSTIQPVEVVELLAMTNGSLFKEEDRLAVVVPSSLVKAGLRQRMPHSGTKAFLSLEAAETWLKAFA